MVKTMNKEDVLYRAPVDTFDLGKIAELSGKSPNTAMKAALVEAKKKKKAGELKKPEGKIGKIDGHLFLRLKDGDTHIDDFLIVKNYAGAQVRPPRSQEYNQKVTGYIQVRTTAFNKLKAGEKSVKQKYTDLQEMLELVKGFEEEAKRGQFGANNPGDRAANKVKDAIGLFNDAERLFNDECHQPFDEHRNYKNPVGVEEADISEYTRSYYLSEWRPVYGKAKEYVAMAKNIVGEIRVAAKNARNFADRADQGAANWGSMAEELAALCETETTAATKVWGLQPYEGVARAVAEDIEKIVNVRTNEKTPDHERPQIIERYLQGASERMIAFKNSFVRMQKHVTKMGELTAQVKTIPKDALKVPKVKESIRRIDSAKKGLASYAKVVEKAFKEAGKNFAEAKKEAALV